MVPLTGLACIVQLVVYNVIYGGTGEQIAHFIEFSFNIVNGATSFWFVSDAGAFLWWPSRSGNPPNYRGCS